MGRKAFSDMMVRDVCMLDAYVVDLNVLIEKLLLTAAERRVGSAVVIGQGQLADVFRSVDTCRCLGEYVGENFSPTAGDVAA